MTDQRAVGPGSVVGFVGLGNMGFPMAGRLAGAGYAVRGYDADPAVRARFAEATAAPVTEAAAEVADGADAVVTMLPNSAIVRSVVVGDGLLDRMAEGAVLVDMSSSEPLRTRELAARTAARGVPLVDAPVSGGVAGARKGTLTVMSGGEPEPVARLRAMLEVLGGKVMHVGPVGAGHALKALNNLLSATHLLASSEAIMAGREFGLDPAVMLDAINVSSGRSASTEAKWPRFMLDRGFDSGFGLRLMLKDMRIAVGLAEATGWPARLGEAAADLWSLAAGVLPADADHTEIVRWLEAEHGPQGPATAGS
ncbi:NAD(P)-dependent oxidoreductase [Actinomadura madurae]|uniref:NAD(P)-dependent oxidoreductase n=1 Tax=Actinomadura madurae TaxID=1993 RepID=UPI002025D798|nr:NAD(P)-dependent oxidoreductase [Actinomadura madurae]URN02997.1 NAD(P)-dependent oxidoreductase [Actinomadura madurae]